MKKNKKIKFSKITVVDLEGNIIPIPEMHKKIGNTIWLSANTIEISDIGRKIHSDEEVELNQDELNEISKILKEVPSYKPFIINTILKYIIND